MIQRPYGVGAVIQGVPLIVTGALTYKVNPTLAAGDAKVTKDGVGAVNCNTLPDAFPAASSHVRIQLTAAEMTAAVIVVNFVDAAGAEWENQRVIIETYGHPSAQHPLIGANGGYGEL
jgi:hypothetical protein